MFVWRNDLPIDADEWKPANRDERKIRAIEISRLEGGVTRPDRSIDSAKLE